MTTPTTATDIYLAIHGITTVGAIIIFLIRNEHRITKTETRLDYLEKSHDTLTAKGTAPHMLGLHKP